MKEVADKKNGDDRAPETRTRRLELFYDMGACVFVFSMEDGGRGTHKRIHIYVCSQEDLEAGELGIF